MLSRRGFVGAAALGALGVPAHSLGQERPPPLDRDLVNDFVRAAHTDLPRTQELLAETPSLLNATWDWGGGDFETALGGASHMGNQPIAEFLLSRGVRIDVFCAAMLGLTTVVEPILAAYPDAVSWKGPHGISLLRHAEAGGQAELVALLTEKGAV